MDGLQATRQDWEANAQLDPMWSILHRSGKVQGATWDVDEFFDTGEREVQIVLGHLASLGACVNFEGTALDFGCGIGRLTRALAVRFKQAIGVDISPTMIELAKQHNRYPQTCTFLVNNMPDLSVFPPDHFSFIYSSIVLQHIPPRAANAYIREFIRVLRPGGLLVFQVPSHLRVRRMRKTASILKTILRGLPVWPAPASGASYRSEMYCIPESEVRGIVETSGASVIDVQMTNATQPDPDYRLRYISSEPQGYVSKQYCAQK